MPTKLNRLQVALPPHIEWALRQDSHEWGKAFPLSYMVVRILDEHYAKLGRGMEEFKQMLKLRGEMQDPGVPIFGGPQDVPEDDVPQQIEPPLVRNEQARRGKS